MKFLGKYMQIKKRDIGIAWKKAKMSKTCYLFLLPYFILFTVFYVLPVCMSVFYSFTYYNVLEPAKFIGVENYIDLLLNDDVFLIAVKNTFLLAATLVRLDISWHSCLLGLSTNCRVSFVHLPLWYSMHRRFPVRHT